MPNLEILILVLAVIVYIFYNQYRTKPVKIKRFIILPLVFIFISYEGMKAFHGNLSTYIPIIALLCIISIILGFLSGRKVKIFTGEDGVLYQRGGIIAIIFLVATIAVKGLAIVILSNTQYAVIAQGDMLTMLMLGCQYAARSISVILKEPKVLNTFDKK